MKSVKFTDWPLMGRSSLIVLSGCPFRGGLVGLVGWNSAVKPPARGEINQDDGGRMRIAATILLAGASIFAEIGDAQAQMLCNACTSDQYREMADAYVDSSGVFLVYDIRNVQLTGWRGIKDRETGEYHAEPVDVPTASMTAYLNVLHLVTTRSGDVVIPLTPDIAPGPGPYYGQNPLNGYGSFNAYDVVRSANVNSNIGNLLASGLRGQSGNTAFDNAIATINSVILGGNAPETSQIKIIVVITWKDGSKTVYTISPGLQAEYQSGKSVDASGNPIPDGGSINNPTIADPLFNGQQFNFRNGTDVTRWVEQMRLFGVPVTGMQTHRIACVRIGGGPLECRYI